MGINTGTISIDSTTEIYRNPEGSHAVFARTEDGEHDLGVSDVTVSRLKNHTAPVVIEPQPSCIEIHNKQNTNGVTVVCDGDKTELDEGLTATVDDTAKISIGYQTELRLSVERDAKTEINVGGDVSGDVVAGDQKTVDDRTQVVDSVVNRSDIGGEEGSQVEDTVVNRSNVGKASEEEPRDDTDTQSHCEVHDRMYSGQICPDCAAEESQPQSTVETKFCMFCGSDIPAVAAVCPDCGEQLPDDP